MYRKDTITGTVKFDVDNNDEPSLVLEYGSTPISDLFQEYDGKKIKITIEKADD